MHASSTLRALSFLAVAALLAVGCKQSEGEPCEVESDCGEGLFCCQMSLSGTDLPDRRGICQTDGTDCTIVVPIPDAGPVPDAGPRDAGPRDAGPDAAVAPDAGTDGGPPDAGTDAGSVTLDAGTDGGPDAG